MQITREEIQHIANLADLYIDENEIENYRENLQEIINFANIVNQAPVEGIDITIGANEKKNVFRKDEVIDFENKDSILQNAPEKELNMFKIPKVIN